MALTVGTRPGSHEITALLGRGFDDFGSAFAPDGKWLAFTVTAGPTAGVRVQGFSLRPNL